MAAALAVLILLGGAVLGVAAAARALDRPIPAAVMAGFAILSVSPYPLAYVANRTPLPLDHVAFTPPWSLAGEAPRNPYLNDIALQSLPWTEAVRLAWKDGALPLRDLPVIVVSGAPEASQIATAVGAVEVLQKPIDVRRLLLTVARHCRESDLRREEAEAHRPGHRAPP